MGKVGIFIRIILLVILYSCKPSQLMIERFQDIDCDTVHIYTTKSNVLRTDGYYHFSITTQHILKDKTIKYNETIEQNILFFDNGMVMYPYYPELFKQTKNLKSDFYIRGPDIGRYSIINDTIRILTIEAPGGMSWLGTEKYFKLINRDKIQFLYCVNPNEKSLKFNSNSENFSHKYSESNFVLDEELPDPNKSWIIKRKWFWCNKEDYKKWKKEHKK